MGASGANSIKDKLKSAIRLLRANNFLLGICLYRSSVTMEPHCALKTINHLLKNRSYYHRNANDRFELKKCGANLD